MLKSLVMAATIACASIALSSLPSYAGTFTFDGEVDTSDPIFGGFANIDLTPFSVSQSGTYRFDVKSAGYTLVDSFAFLFPQGSALNDNSALIRDDDSGGSVRRFGGGLGTYQATISGPGDINAPTQAVPTPALLPGLIGMSVAAMRKRKAEQSTGEA
jgi:hypothetical protein